ncbi:MAG: hypothetical protein ACFCU5_04415 [Pleurocapsa sp.]
MQYGDLPVFIPLFAAAYLLTIYGLLKIAERSSETKEISSNNVNVKKAGS